MASFPNKAEPTSKLIDLPPEIQHVKDTLSELVNPEYRSEININPDHVHILTGTKSKKQVTRKRRAIKKKTLTRKERSEMGLYSIPTKSLKYTDMLALHTLWKGYMKEHLSLDTLNHIPGVADPQYDSFSKLLVKADLHGAKISVIRSKCPSYVGTSGIIVLDTKNTLKILGEDNKLRTIPKTECIFVIELGKIEITIIGKHLTIRPAERSTKKMKNFMDLGL